MTIHEICTKIVVFCNKKNKKFPNSCIERLVVNNEYVCPLCPKCVVTIRIFEQILGKFN